MFTRRFRQLAAALSMLALLAGGATAVPAASAEHIIKIGADLPLSGADATDGIPILNGIKLAVEQANHKAPSGYRFVVDALDDTVAGLHSPQQGATNVQSLVADKAVLGMVGPFNSNVAAAEIPISNAAGLAMVNQSATNPDLTLSAKFRSSKPDLVTFFRVCATDNTQGEAGAQFYKAMGFNRVYIVDDNETFGLGVAAVFERAFRQLGGTVLGHDHLTAQQQDFKSLLTKIAATHPDAIYFGGVTSTGGALLRSQMAGAGLDPAKVAFLGTDGISDEAFIKTAGSAADNTYYTVAGPNPSELPAAKDFIKQYKATFHTDIGSYSANAYVATQVLIAAVEEGIRQNHGAVPTRLQVVTNLQHTKSFPSIIGTFSFTKTGDTTNPIISLWKIEHGKQVFVKQATVKAG